MKRVLAINGGSSSIRFAVFDMATPLRRSLSGKIDLAGSARGALSYSQCLSGEQGMGSVHLLENAEPAKFLIDWIKTQIDPGSITGVGHRVVHGGNKLSAPQVVNDDLISELRRITPYDPDHLPAEIRLIELFHDQFPGVPQIVCFDTTFHQNMPAIAKTIAIPRRYQEQGVRRYGFHGLSYAFLLQELERLTGAEASHGRAILAHLGSGASMAAVRDQVCVDTTMGFTPASGLVMSTRSGDIDPGLVAFLAQSEGMTPAQFDLVVNHQSGLLGVSGTSADMQELLARESEDHRAAEAVSLFCYQARKWIGAYAAVLGGVDTLVFSGGIGENAPPVRARICEGLEFLGIEIEQQRNAKTAEVISTEASRVTVRVIRTDEELMIARSVCDVVRPHS
jgi:acetate kinase